MDHLDRSVVGQDRAKRTLAIAVSNHFVRLLDVSDRGSSDPIITEAIREVARIAHDRGTGARGLRAVIEGVLEPVLFDSEQWSTYFIDEVAVRGGTIGKIGLFDVPESHTKPASPDAPLSRRLGRRAAMGS